MHCVVDRNVCEECIPGKIGKLTSPRLDLPRIVMLQHLGSHIGSKLSWPSQLSR